MKYDPKMLWLLGLIFIFQCNPKQADKDVYFFSYFKGNGEDGLHLAYSYDGLKWDALNNDESFLQPEISSDKLMRDPCICQGPDGLFHMVWTVSWNERGIGYASSKDLIHWSEQKYIPVMEHEPDARNCWAPEIFYDDQTKEYLIFWATTIPGKFPKTDHQDNRGNPEGGYNHRMYYVTTRDFKDFSETKIFYDYGFNVIDVTLVKLGEKYIMFLKDETNKPFEVQKNIRMAVSDQAAGPYGPPSPAITGEYWAEGPTAIQIGETWHLYFDKYVDKHYGVIVSKDMRHWDDVSDQLKYPGRMRHGTVFMGSETLLESLIVLSK